MNKQPIPNSIPWEELETSQQQQIQRALSTTKNPRYFVAPSSQAELCEVVSLAQQQNEKILPCGNGTKLSWGGLVEDIDLVVSTKNLHHIIEHAVGDLTVTLEAGVTLQELQDTLKPTGQFIPLDPAYPESATIGGIIATGDSGNWRQRYSGVRDMVLGISCVRSDGKMTKAGGRVVKNVAGYDLMKLFTGSYGTLGIIAQVTLRTYPLPEASRTILLTGTKDEIATVTNRLRASSLSPTCANVISASVVQQLTSVSEMGLMVRFQSIEPSVRQQSQQLIALGKQHNLSAQVIDGDEEQKVWRQMQQLARVAATEKAITCKLGVLPNNVVTILQQLETLTSGAGLGTMLMSSGLGYVSMQLDDGISTLEKLRLYCQQQQGFLTILEAPIAVKQKLEPWGYTGNAGELMRKIKQQFDPQNIFSPGRFF